MKRTQRKFNSTFKTKVAIEALKERENLAVLAKRFELHPNQISQWKQEFAENSSQIFKGKNRSKETDDVDSEQLYSKIGKLEMENDFLKKLKEVGKTIDLKLLIDNHSDISIRSQCDFLDIPRSSFYHIPKGESKQNLMVMKLMDKHILEEPTAGVLTMQPMLKDNRLHCFYKQVRRLMRKSNIRAI